MTNNVHPVTESSILALYEAILLESQKMLECARNELWDELLQLEETRKTQFEELQQKDKGQFNSPNFQLKKTKLIQFILEADNETMTLSRVWMGEIQDTLNAATQDKRLKSVYGGSGG